jgi:hypothetical protein
MNAAFESLFAQHAMLSHAKQLALMDIYKESAWNTNLAQGTLTLGDKSFAAGLLGSFSAIEESWLWSWANENMGNLPVSVTAVAKQMKELGETNDIPELRNAGTEISEFECHRLAMVAVGVSGAGAYYRGPYNGGAAFLVIQEPLPPRSERHNMLRITRVITDCITNFEMPHHEAVTAYFKSEGLSIEMPQPDEMIAAGADGQIHLRFNERGSITKISTPPLLHNDGITRTYTEHSFKESAPTATATSFCPNKWTRVIVLFTVLAILVFPPLTLVFCILAFLYWCSLEGDRDLSSTYE